MEDFKSYLEAGRLMQLATSHDGQPWVCTVYYVIDEDLNFYWLSLPSRRHSQEIELNGRVAAAVAVKASLPVIGIQVEGHAEKVTDAVIIEKIMRIYVAKYEKGEDFYKNFIAGKNQHDMYKLSPVSCYMIDEVNFPAAGRREINDIISSNA